MRYLLNSAIFTFVLFILGINNYAHAWKMEAGTLTLSATSSLTQLESHTFQQIYDVPPIVIALPTSEGSQPGAVRISNISTTGFRMSPVEPKSEDGPHAAMTVSYIAIEPGLHSFPDGEFIEAGTISTDTMQFNGNPNGRKGWDTVSFSRTFASPILLASIQSITNETATIPRQPSEPWLTVAVDNISNTQADIALERSEVYDRITGSNFQFDNLSSNEDIGYVVMDRNLIGNFRASGNLLVNFETIYSASSIDGWNNGCDTISYSGSYSATPIAVATKSSRNDGDGGWFRECSSSSSSLGLSVDEDTDQDNERSHGNEDASLLVFSSSFYYDSNAATSLTTANSLMLESNSATLSPSSFTTINFDQVYPFPPAVFLLEDNQNPEPSSVRIRNITEESFQVVPVEPDSIVSDASDQTTTINYLAISKGEFTFPDGTEIEIGPVVPPDEISNFQSKRLSGDSWFNFSFATSFGSTPAFLSQIQSMNSETVHTPGSPSQPWMTTAARNISSSGGEIALDRAETNTGSISAAEEFAYLAIEAGLIADFQDISGTTISSEAQTTPDNLAGSIACDTYNFLQSYSASPLVVGSQMTWDGGDGGWLRRCSTSNTQVSFKIEEDWALDQDNSHTTERAGFMAFSEPFSADFSLVANYQLEGPSWNGTAGEVIDSSNSGLNGQAVGDARAYPAQVCNGALFDGTGDYIEIPDDPILDISDELTVMAWVNAATLPSSDLMTIVSKDTNFEFHLDTAGRVFWWWNNSSGSSRSFTSDASTLSTGTWHHVAITYSKSEGSQKIFVDGVEANSQSYTNESLINNSIPLHIGTDYAYRSRDFNGSIDEVKIFERALSTAAIQKYAAESRPCASCVLGSFDIAQPSYSLACPDTRAAIDITARCVDGTVKTDYTGTVNLSGPSGSTFYDAASAGTEINSLTYDFSDSGVLTTYLYFDNENTNVQVTANDTAASVSSTAATGTDFRAFGFNVTTEPSSFACSDSTTMTMVAYGQTDFASGGACEIITGFDGNKTLDSWFRATVDDDNIADTLSQNLTVAGTNISAQDASAADNLTLEFINGEASFDISYSNAAKFLDLNFRYDTAPYDGSEFSAMAASTDEFVSKPSQFLIQARSGATSITGASSSSGTTHAAGQAFDLSLLALCSDGNLAGDYAPNQTSDTIMSYLQRTGPLGGSSVDGTMNISATKELTSDDDSSITWESAEIPSSDFTSGIYSYSGARYSEVGLTRLHFKDQDYFGEEITASSLNIGRFIPDHFEVSTTSGSLSPFCSPSSDPDFSYIGQEIAYASLPTVLIQARNANNEATQNYTESGYMKLSPTDVSRFFPSEDETALGQDGANELTITSSALIPASFTTSSAGNMLYTFLNTDRFTYNRDANSLVAPVNTGVKVQITDIEDSDSVGSNAEPYDIEPNGIQLRYGRWAMDNAFGPETQSLGIPMRIESWNGSSFVTNTSDDCSSFSAANLIDTESLSGGSTTPSGSGTLGSGEAARVDQIRLSSPGENNLGSVGLEYQVDSWLRFDWDNDASTADTNPTATAIFGQYRGHDTIIYWREINN